MSEKVEQFKRLQPPEVQQTFRVSDSCPEQVRFETTMKEFPSEPPTTQAQCLLHWHPRSRAGALPLHAVRSQGCPGPTVEGQCPMRDI